MALAAGITATGLTLGGLMSSMSQSSANTNNLRVARETNQQNERLFNRSLAWQEDMWNKTNAYNDPSHQVDMLLKAGINPAAVYGSGQASPASMPSVPSAPQMQGATVSPVDYSWIGNSLSTGVNAFFNNNLINASIDKTKNDAQIAKVNAELDTAALKHRLTQIVNSAYTSEYEKDQAKIQMKIMEQTQQDAVKQASWQTKIQESEYERQLNAISESKLQQEAQRVINQYLPAIQEQTLKQYKANVASLFASAKANDASAVESCARKLLLDLQKEGVKLDNKQKEDILNAVVDKAWNEADESYWKASQVKKTFNHGWLGTAVPNWPGANEPSDRSEMGTNKAFDYRTNHRVPRNRSKSGVR